jgi:hypothetical protein
MNRLEDAAGRCWPSSGWSSPLDGVAGAKANRWKSLTTRKHCRKSSIRLSLSLTFGSVAKNPAGFLALVMPHYGALLTSHAWLVAHSGCLAVWAIAFAARGFHRPQTTAAMSCVIFQAIVLLDAWSAGNSAGQPLAPLAAMTSAALLLSTLDIFRLARAIEVQRAADEAFGADLRARTRAYLEACPVSDLPG